MRKISFLFLGTILWVIPPLAWAAENHDLLETTVENWVKKKLPMGSHLEKIIYDLKDLNEYKDSKISGIKEGHNKLSLSTIHTCFANDHVSLKIEYDGEKNVTASYSEPLNFTQSFANHTSTPSKTTIKTPELWDHFTWNLDHPLTYLYIGESLHIPMTRSTNANVNLTFYDNRTFQGKAKKNTSESTTLNIPANSELRDKGTVTKECIEQAFTLYVTMDIHFAVLYKTFTKKSKIDVYSLSSVFSSKHNKGAVTLTRSGIFKGVYVTHLEHQLLLKDLSTKEEKVISGHSRGY